MKLCIHHCHNMAFRCKHTENQFLNRWKLFSEATTDDDAFNGFDDDASCRRPMFSHAICLLHNMHRVCDANAVTQFGLTEEDNSKSMTFDRPTIASDNP